MEYFIRLSAEGSYSVAASKLGISQPTLTQAIKKIEQSLGVSLFDRNGKDFKINNYGKLFLETCKKVTGVYNDCVQNISDIGHGTTGVIKVGVAPSRAPGVMPSIIRNFREKYSETRIEIQERLTLGIEKSVESGELDIGILVVSEKNNPLLSYVPLTTEGILIAMKDSVMKQSKKLCSYDFSKGVASAPLRDFEDVPFILLGEDQPVVRQFRSACDENCIYINCVARCKNYDTSLAMANEGIGATVIPDDSTDYYKNLFPQLKLFFVSDVDFSRGLYLIHRKNMYINDPVKYFIDTVISSYAK